MVSLSVLFLTMWFEENRGTNECWGSSEEPPSTATSASQQRYHKATWETLMEVCYQLIKTGGRGRVKAMLDEKGNVNTKENNETNSSEVD